MATLAEVTVGIANEPYLPRACFPIDFPARLLLRVN